ncbi:MAG: hypothetical protein Q8L55_00215 [Phycisphaerales bacterium]|nr:hypothetical protein [Phycisphaerales bacterium]
MATSKQPGGCTGVWLIGLHEERLKVGFAVARLLGTFVGEPRWGKRC